MKKRLLAILLVLCMTVALLPASASAAEIVAEGTCGDNLNWVLTDDGTLTISGEGEMSSYTWGSYKESTQSIQSVIIEQGVTTIGNYAFSNCDSLTSVTIPEGITVIGEEAFENCACLTGVTFPETVTQIGVQAFSNCDGLTEVTIPNSVWSIGTSAFVACDGLSSVTIGKSVSWVGGGAFNNCTNLSKVTFRGSAPIFEASEDGGRIYVFYGVTATVYYPADDDTWTAWKRSDYGGDLTWVPYEPPHTHEYTATVTEPTCTEDGFTTYTCSCGDSYTDALTDALGHDTVTSVVVPTCTEGGYTLTTCTRCELHERSDETAATGHDWSGAVCGSCGAARNNPFTDVPSDSFYFDPVMWAVENGITTGTSDTTFSPDNPCQRAAVVTFLWRAAGEPEPTSANNPFVDVKESDFFYKAVLWAVENGITNGTDATHFSPYAVCNRAAVVTFLHRAMGSPAPESTVNPFTDVDEKAFYYVPMLWAVENGITNGLTATTFGPTADCNRAQIVTFLYRAYN